MSLYIDILCFLAVLKGSSYIASVVKDAVDTIKSIMKEISFRTDIAWFG